MLCLRGASLQTPDKHSELLELPGATRQLRRARAGVWRIGVADRVQYTLYQLISGYK